MRLAPMIAFVYLSFVWGSTYLFIKMGLAYWPPFLMGSARNLGASVVLMGAILLFRRAWPREWRSWWPPLAFGVINGSALAFIFWGEQYIPSGQTAVIIATVPLFTLLFAGWWGKEPITWARTAAVALGIAGVLLATGTKDGSGFEGSLLQRVAGQGAMLAAAACYAASYVFGRRFFRADIFVNTALHLASSGIYLGLLSLAWDRPVTVAVLSWPALGSLMYLAIPGSAIAYWCMFYLMEHMDSLQTSYVTMLNPLVALFLGFIVLAERITVTASLGTALVLSGVWLINQKGHRTV